MKSKLAPLAILAVLGLGALQTAVAQQYPAYPPPYAAQYPQMAPGYPGAPPGYPVAPAAYMQGGPEGAVVGEMAPPAEAGGCPDGSCGGGDACLPRTFGTIEFLQWWIEGRETPPLVTTNPLGTPQNQTGHLDAVSTSVLFGGSRIDAGGRSGTRLSLGMFLDDCQMFAIGANYWDLNPSDTTFHIDSFMNGGTSVPIILARPFINATNGLHDASLIAYTDTSGVVPVPINEGSIDIRSQFSMKGGEAYTMLLWGRDCCGPGKGYRLDLLSGYRYTKIEDSLVITTFSRSLDVASVIPVGTTITVTDSFRTQNEIQGGELALAAEYYRGPITFSFLGKFGVANNHERVAITGSTVTVTPNPGGTTTTTNQGLLALSSNIGNYSQNRIIVTPEINANLSYRINDHLDFTIGYSLIYWNLVATAGNQIDLTINPTLLTPIPSTPLDRPRASFVNSELYAQGLNFGFNWRW